MSLKLLDLILFAYILLDIPNDTTTSKILFIELVDLGAINRVNANPLDIFRMGNLQIGSPNDSCS